jgi:predicted site-specific integrase-resolvase
VNLLKQVGTSVPTNAHDWSGQTAYKPQSSASEIKRMKYKGKAVGYARVSTEGQATDGKGLHHQVDAIRNAACTQRYELLGIYEEVASAASENGVTHRPALQDAASTAAREGAVMIVADASRLFRNVQVAVEFFREHQVKVFSVKDGKILRSKELLRGIAPAEAAAETIGRGTTSALQSRMFTAGWTIAAGAGGVIVGKCVVAAASSGCLGVPE